SSASILPVATQRVANVWHTSFSLSYNGIPIRERRLQTTIGCITGQLLTVTGSFPGALPNATVPVIDRQFVDSKLGTYLGVDQSVTIQSQTEPELVYVHFPASDAV